MTESIQVSGMREALKQAIARLGPHAFVRVELIDDGVASLLWEVGVHEMNESVVKGVGKSARDALLDVGVLERVDETRALMAPG